MTLRGKHIILTDLGVNIMADCIDEAKLDYEYGKKDPYVKKPDKFSHSKWVTEEEMVYTYFTAMENIQGVSLAYFICKAPDPSGIVINREQEIIQHYSLQGNMVSYDTKKVLAILKELTVDTDAEIWMKGKLCGQ